MRPGCTAAKGEYGEADKFIGVRMGQVFALAKEFIELPLDEIEKLLESPVHEVRAGGLSIIGQQAHRKKTPESRRKELNDLYIRRHDRVNNWDLVDLGALHVVGIYLVDKRREYWYSDSTELSRCHALHHSFKIEATIVREPRLKQLRDKLGKFCRKTTAGKLPVAA